MITKEIIEKLLEFRRKRDWEKFHNPKDLAVSLVIEASELLENFQWKTDTEVDKMLNGKTRKSIEDEIADIAIYLTYLINDLGIDAEKAIKSKIRENEKKYPAARVHGSAKKYTRYKS